MSDSIRIPLTRGQYAIVDAEDAERVSQYRWYAQPNGKRWYAIREERVGGETMTVRMHRFIMNPPPDKEIDHRNGDGLDNRRSNLRLCEHRQNMLNKGMNRNNTSGFKGVHQDPYGRWIAGVSRNGLHHHIGVFDTPEAAARARDKKIRELDGEFVRPHFPDDHVSVSKPPDRRKLRSGERNNKAKLTWEIVREIRRRHAAGGVTQRALATEYGVHNTIIGDVVNGKTWRE